MISISAAEKGWIIVTGAGGFVGQRLVTTLLNAGYSVAAIVRQTNRPNGFPADDNDSFKLFRADLTGDLSDVVEAGLNVGAIVHLAAQVVLPGVIAEQFALNNINTTIGAVRLAEQLDPPTFIFHSSTSVYGAAQDAKLTEASPSISPQAYGASKYLAEMIVKQEGERRRVIAPRTPGIIGPGANPNFTTSLIERASAGEPINIQNPEALFNHALHVDDYCRFVLSVLGDGKPAPGFDVVNLASRAPVSLRSIAEQVIDAMSSVSPLTFNETDAKPPTIDVSKVENQYGYQPMAVAKAVDLCCKEFTSAT